MLIFRPIAVIFLILYIVFKYVFLLYILLFKQYNIKLFFINYIKTHIKKLTTIFIYIYLYYHLSSKIKMYHKFYCYTFNVYCKYNVFSSYMDIQTKKIYGNT